MTISHARGEDGAQGRGMLGTRRASVLLVVAPFRGRRNVVVQDALGTFYLLAPLIGGAVVHGACMLGFLARPTDGGRTLGGRPRFGPTPR